MINLKETKRVKDLLMNNPEDYLNIIEGTELAICITNAKGDFVAINNNYTELYGYSREELLGNHFSMVLPEENKKGLTAYHDRFFVDKYEIIRKWAVKNKKGELMEIFADAGYNDKVNNAPHKVTLVKFVQKLTEMPVEKNFAHTSGF